MKTFSAQGCTGLSGVIDLSGCLDIREVDVSNTTVSIMIPTEAKLTKFELGTPTQVSIINPTSLTPSAVQVDHCANISSIDLINIPNYTSFNMFAKIMNTL